MCGSTSTTRSPSTVSTIRKTPWVLGCCGPMLMLTSIVSSCCSCTMVCSSGWAELNSAQDRAEALSLRGPRPYHGLLPPVLLLGLFIASAGALADEHTSQLYSLHHLV